MYTQWAARRGMRFEALESGLRASVLLSVTRFAAYPILQSEQGIHVLEEPGDGRAVERVRVRVIVVPQPSEPATGKELVSQARRLLSDPGARPATVVRRYRRDPSPLVRDGVRGFRTGHLARVFAGDFDLF